MVAPFESDVLLVVLPTLPVACLPVLVDLIELLLPSYTDLLVPPLLRLADLFDTLLP